MSIPPGGHNPEFVRLAEEARNQVEEISTDEYLARAGSERAGSLVDVRDESEYRDGHAKGAVNLSRGTIERDIAVFFPHRDARLVLYCGGGYRSALAANNLRRMGYTNAVSLAGGWRAIESSGIEVESREDLVGKRETFNLPGARCEIVSDTPEASILEMRIEPKGEVSIPRRKGKLTSYYILMGSVDVVSDGSVAQLHEGGYAQLGVEQHALRTNGQKPARVLLTLLPGGLNDLRI